MSFFFFDDKTISRIDLVFSSLPWNIDNGDPCPSYVKELKERGSLDDEGMLNLRVGLGNIINRCLGDSYLRDPSFADYLNIANLAMNCLRDVKEISEKTYLEFMNEK